MPAWGRPRLSTTPRIPTWRSWLLACGLCLCAAPAQALDLNQATEAELDNLAGFGPAFTARVMQARAERPFESWSDFTRRVKGVREATATRLSRQGARIQQEAYPPTLSLSPDPPGSSIRRP
ncbi:MAG: helix-hairpin-helix domain-containing protein [Limnohabitans sp.]|mgnify:FL=1|nr:helix-hairpin-helix domain-containing protein [Limnohabitans sp.]